MTLRVPATGRNIGLDSVFDRADAGSGPATLQIRTGSQPANADTAASGTLLVTFTLNDPAFNAAAAGVKGLNTSSAISAVAVAGGTAGWGRLLDSDGNTIMDGNVATSAADFTINATAITLGQSISLTGGSITDPV